MSRFSVLVGDCREKLRELDEASVDAVVTDPPYEIAFMGRGWDSSGIAYDVDLWREALRVLKPGGYLLAFGATRTYHRMACAIEDAGFEIRDSIHWMYGSGFPKSLDVSKAIDKAAGAERPVIGERSLTGSARIVGGQGGATAGLGAAAYDGARLRDTLPITGPATDEARRWSGWGTALKPAHEPIIVARKPIVGTVAANVLAHGVGGINVDGCRLGDEVRVNPPAANKPGGASLNMSARGMPEDAAPSTVIGRWPPNVVFSHLPTCEAEACAEGCAVAELDEQSGVRTSGSRKAGVYETQGYMGAKSNPMPEIAGDTGGASRFFPAFRYQSKPSRRERDAGLDDAGIEEKTVGTLRGGISANDPVSQRFTKTARNTHPTVKPVELMRWLVRLVTPRDGLVLDPFVGSGTTGIAALLEGARFIGVELLDDHAAIARARIEHAAVQPMTPRPVDQPKKPTPKPAPKKPSATVGVQLSLF